MSKENYELFVSVKDSEGEKFFCPINTLQALSSERIEEIDDCVEENVVGRYAGHLTIKPS